MMLISDFDRDIELVIINLFQGENQTPAFLAINPLRAVPVLLDVDFRLTESTAILKYLALTFELPVYPTPLPTQIRVDEATARFATGFDTVVLVLVFLVN